MHEQEVVGEEKGVLLSELQQHLSFFHVRHGHLFALVICKPSNFISFEAMHVVLHFENHVKIFILVQAQLVLHVHLLLILGVALLLLYILLLWDLSL